MSDYAEYLTNSLALLEDADDDPDNTLLTATTFRETLMIAIALGKLGNDYPELQWDVSKLCLKMQEVGVHQEFVRPLPSGTSTEILGKRRSALPPMMMGLTGLLGLTDMFTLWLNGPLSAFGLNVL